MFCDRCGFQLDPSAAFCSRCGKQAGGGGSSRVPARGRIAGHIRLLAILWMALSAFRLLPGVILVLITGAGIQFLPAEVPAFVYAILPAIGGVFLVTGLIGIVTGWGLLTRQPWARIVAIVAGFFNLFDVPFGTVLGIYTLWVLLPTESAHEYRTAAHTV
jgi:hypothetical protein